MAAAKGRLSGTGVAYGCAALLMLAFFWGYLDLNRVQTTLYERLCASAAMIAMIAATPVFLRLPGNRCRAFFTGHETRSLLLLLGFAIAPRLIWTLAFPPRIESDYALYVRMATTYAETGKPEIDPYMLSIATGSVPYSVLTGLVMRVFGTGAGTLVWMAEVLHACNILLLYLLARNMTTAPRAFFAAAAFALLPENICYSNLPGVEAPALFTLLSGLLPVVRVRKLSGRHTMLPCFLGGTALVFSACIRPSAWAALAASAILILTDSGDKRNASAFSARLISLLALTLGAALMFGGYRALQSHLFADGRPASGIGWSVYEGLDLESGGKWTEEKSARMAEVISTCSPAEAEKVFLTEGLTRYRGYSFGEKVRLFLRKGGSMWYESMYALFSAEYSPEEDRLTAWCCGSWWLCLAAFVFSLFHRASHLPPGAVRRAAAMPLIIILLTVMWHEIGTSIGRYHYMLIPFVLLSAAILLPGKRELQQAWNTGKTGQRFRPAGN